MGDGAGEGMYNKRCSFDAAVPMLGGPAAANRDRHYGSRELNTMEQRSRFRKRKSLLLFERASPKWWNPQFSSKLLETEYWRCAFPQIRDRFRLGLIYIVLTTLAWFIYRVSTTYWSPNMSYHLGCLAIIATALGLLAFTFTERLYMRFYVPASFLCTFLICVASLLLFSLSAQLVSPLGTFATSMEVILLLYTVIPLPFYVCIISGLLYSVLFEILTVQSLTYERYYGAKIALHLCAHLLGIHLFILTQVRNRKTFIKVGQSLLARKDLEVERAFKQRMIESVMPVKVAEELLKESSELRRPSTADGKREKGNIFRPFTMNLMQDVSILFADIAGFTKMSSNKTADELVDLLNDLFGRFDTLCTASGCEKISTLGDCYYCVSGCPEPNPRHAHNCVEMGLGMVIAIRQFDEDRGQEVNMRVGIHTGIVMCGIVGTKRFKFDVFSNDVTLANTMESSGMAGRVHVSEPTAKFLGNDYILEPGEDYQDMKTYFVVGRSTDLQKKETSAPSIPQQTQSSIAGSKEIIPSAPALKQRGPITGKPDTETPLLPWNNDDLRHIDSSEMESDAAMIGSAARMANLQRKVQSQNSLPRTGGGSLRTRLLHYQASDKDKKKSISLAALSSAQSAKKVAAAQHTNATEPSVDHSSSNSNAAHGEKRSTRSPDRASQNRQSPPVSQQPPKSQSPHHSGGGGVTISNDISASDHVSDREQTKNLFESVFEYHATSVTRFDTAHMDFDQRLVQCIQDSQQQGGGDLINRRDALQRWSLKFRDPNIEKEYRAHFSKTKPRDRRSGSMDEKWIVAAPKYSVFIDLIISVIIFVIVSAVAFGVFHNTPKTSWYVYFSIAMAFLAIFLAISIWYLAKNRTLIPLLTNWVAKHIVCLILIDLPLGAALANWFCPPASYLTPPYEGSQGDRDRDAPQLVIAYIMIVVIFAHCNFSQLINWTKTLVAIIVGVILLGLVTGGPCADTCPPAPLVVNATTEPPVIALTNGTTPHSMPTTTTAFSFEPPVFNCVLYRYEVILDVVLMLILIAFLNYQFEASFRLSFLGDVQAYRTIRDMQDMKEQADWLLGNIIPHHVVDHLAKNSKYSESHEMVAVVFASIFNWGDMYEETFEGGREFLRVLNELIADFDDLLDRPQFAQVEKIKTIGATYMAASGLNPERRRLSMHPYSHLYDLMDFALELQEVLDNFNKDILNFEFKMKVGYNIGPITAGVIGTTKLYYDIWGDTVNIASRMYSTGVKGKIQVSKKAKDMLEDVYDFKFRDHIEVKGIDAGMDVFLLVGRKENMKPRSPTGTGEI